MQRLFFLYLCTLLICFSAQAEVSNTDTIAVLQIEQEQGLSQLGATSLQFDDNGYLWTGTQNGLNRFNGNQMKVWLANRNQNGLPDDHIRAMYYQNDTLWMTTNTYSLCAYLLSEDRFLHYADQLDLENNHAVRYSYALYATKGHHLIVGTVGHCLLYDRNRESFDILPVPQILDNDFVTCITELRENLYLIGTNASGLYILDISTKTIVLDPLLQPLQQSQVNALYRGGDGVVFIGTDKGLYKTDGQLNRLHRVQQGTIRSIQYWDEDKLLIGAKNHTFFLDDSGVRQDVVFVNHNGQEMVSDILAYAEDMQGGRWMGTETRGIFYYHPLQTKFTPKRIQAENSPKRDFISTFNFLRDGDDLWMATEFGFVKHSLHTSDYKLYRTDLLEYTLAKDAEETIWAGGFEQGLLYYDRQADRFRQVPLPFKDKDIIEITPVASDTLWIHTWSSGIYALHIPTLKAQKVTLFGKDILRPRISLVDKQGNIWIGSDEGLYQVTKNRKITYYDSLSNERVFAIDEGPSGNIWVGTAKGLNKLDPRNGHITQFKIQAGLPNDFIYSVEADDNENIWVSTNYGISVLSHETGAFTNYTEDDGLQNNEFNGKAGYRDSLGYLYFGGMNGFNVFHPDSIPINTHRGTTHIEEVLLFGHQTGHNILYTDTLIFSHDQNVITFGFVNLNYLWSKKNRYQFMLEGFDKEWRPITQDHSTTYTNLSPGTYRFKVKGSNNELLWGNTDEITVIIRSPWYATTAFRVGMGLLVLLLIAGGVTYKGYQQRQTNRRLRNMVEQRTEELSKANDALFQSLGVTRQQKENISFLMQELNHRVKNNLQLITSLIDIQSFEIDDRQIQDKLRILQSRVFTVAKIHDLLNVRESDKGASIKRFINRLATDLIAFSGQNIDFESDIVEDILPSNQLTYLGLILNELITNSIKHAFREEQIDKLIHISVKPNGDMLVLRYKDNGIGFDTNKTWSTQHKGMGLIQLLVKELKGTLEINTDQGAIFVIRLQ
jgi:two-component sensor histidine kinase/streptogramin lyase